jgi:hypothetical protein
VKQGEHGKYADWVSTLLRGKFPVDITIIEEIYNNLKVNNP